MVSQDKHEKWLKQRFKDVGVEPLTDKQRKELEEKMHGYLGFRKSLETGIEEHAKAIKSLRERIETEIPSVPKATYIHTCGYKAAIRIGRTPSPDDNDVYYCLFCDREYI